MQWVFGLETIGGAYGVDNSISFYCIVDFDCSTYRIVGLKISQGQTFICLYSLYVLVFVIFKFWFVFWLFRIQLRKRLYDR